MKKKNLLLIIIIILALMMIGIIIWIYAKRIETINGKMKNTPVAVSAKAHA